MMEGLIQNNDIFYVLPILVLFITGLIPITLKLMTGNVERYPFFAMMMTVLGLLAAGVLLVIYSMFGSEIGVPDHAFHFALVFDSTSMWVGFLVLAASAASAVVMYENPATRSGQFSELLFLLCGASIGMLVLVLAADLLMVFVGIETMSLALYLLIATSKEQQNSKEAAFKYFVLGGFSSAFFLYGMALIYGTTGTTYIHEISAKAPGLIGTSSLFLIGTVMLIVGFAFKVSLFPFHSWTPDVYQGAPTPVSAMMSTAVKAVSFAAFLRMMMGIGPIENHLFINLLEALAVLTMLVGNFGALVQKNLKRMLAYSSIAHSGYLFVGLITVSTTKSAGGALFGTTSIVFYLVGYTIMTFGAFAFVSLLERTENTEVKVDELGGLPSRRPFLALGLTLFLLSLAGLPPTIGFFGKFYLFSAAIEQGYMGLAIWGVLNSVLSVYYYLRPIVAMYMREGDLTFPSFSNWGTTGLVIAAMILVVALGIVSGQIYNSIEITLRAGMN